MTTVCRRMNDLKFYSLTAQEHSVFLSTLRKTWFSSHKHKWMSARDSSYRLARVISAHIENNWKEQSPEFICLKASLDLLELEILDLDKQYKITNN